MLLDPYHRGIRFGARVFSSSQSAKRLIPLSRSAENIVQFAPKQIAFGIGLKLVREFFHPTVVNSVKAHNKRPSFFHWLRHV